MFDWSDWLSKRGYLAWNSTCAWRDIADISHKQKLLKTKMQLVLGKKILRNEQIYRKWMSAKFWTNMKATHTQIYEKMHWHWLWRGFHCLCTGAAHKNRKHLILPDCFNYAIQEKFTAWQVNSMLNFTWKTDITLITSRFVQCRFFMWNLTVNFFYNITEFMLTFLGGSSCACS